MSDHFPRRAYGAAVALLALPSVVLAGCHRAESDPRSEPPLVRTAISQPDRGASREFTGIVAARVQSVTYEGGRFRIEAAVEAASHVLHFVADEPCRLQMGDAVRLAIDDGWIIP